MNTIESAISLRNEKRIDEAIEVLRHLLDLSPDDAKCNYQMAWCHDLLGKEKEAVPYYLKSIKNGLDATDLKGAYLGLGSTYRAIGDYQKSRDVFLEGISKFPENKEFLVFLSMTLYNLDYHKEAMKLLLNLVCDTTNYQCILAYERAIRFYSDKLDEIW
ncbi:MAG: tetratricopeptide repeat protein [Candidatus Riflebacteria bacterium]|nr:tetratricopeptide repeat protein [Candidatus Riflebacteria bacterium]